ncbi:MAG: hypothetical protein PHC64_09165 [Candidatus Gastranaerophilales bacterium]|nr:hypothetical protein [Candidatus Gastranaerophilales bacterium]
MTIIFFYNDNKFVTVVPGFGATGITIKPENKKKDKKKIKTHSMLGSILGTGISSSVVVSQTKASGNLFNKILNTDFVSSKNILIVALASVLGGFTGGMLEDKGKNQLKKIKEAIFQILSNIGFPLLFRNIFKNMNDKITAKSSKIIKQTSNFVSVFGGVILGAIVGSTIANKINDSICPDKAYKRKLGAKDFLIHVDDLPTAFAFAGVPYIDKLIPFILVSRGYEVGKQ